MGDGRRQRRGGGNRSGLYQLDPELPSDDRLYAIRNFEGRWSRAAVAVALTMESARCSSVDQWVGMLDAIERALSSVVAD